ncbi:MAG: TMAO reductase system periplasmic protein TorT [Burkholderiaceae bacterium]|nr:TMAO reductase system periplasmic protein TorT [Burkholderiaceae bacterium]
MITMKFRFLRTGFVALAVAAGGAHAGEWHPLKVNARAPGQEARYQLADYRPLDKASRDWSICVSFPHLKDPFFVAVNHGMIEEAKRLGVRVQTMDAGGYTGLNTQISQIENCVAGGAQAVVMAAIAADGMNNLLTRLKDKGIPVVDAVNGVTSADTGVRVLTSPRDEGLRAGQYLARKHPAGSKTVKVAWLPGPAGAGFVEAFDAGFQEGIKGSAAVIAETKHGDVGKEVQARLVEDLLQTHKDLDYIVGTAVMAEAAVPLLKARRVADKVKLVSVYMTPGVFESVRAGDVEAAGAAPVVLIGRIMLDSAVRLLEKKVEFTDVNTIGQVYTKANIGSFDVNTVLAPASFRPVFRFAGK